MATNLSDIQKYFAGKIKQVYNDCDSSYDFIDAELVTPNKKKYLEHYIYVGKTSMFKGEFEEVNNSCFLLINDSNMVFEKNINSNVIIEINENEDIFEIYNEVRALFARDSKYNQFKIALLENFLLGEDIYSIINTASQLIGNPLIVIDLSFKVLANSPIENMKDLLWIDNVKKGYCSYEFISELKKIESLKRGRATEYPFEVTCSASPIKKVVFKIKVEGKIVGNVLLFEGEKKIEEDDYDYLILISDIISKELGKKQFYKNTTSVLNQEILYDLLDNNIKNEIIFKERLKNSSLIFSTHIFILVIDISNFKHEKSAYSRYLNSNLITLFPKSNSIYYGENVVIINNRDEFLEDGNKIKTIEAFLLKNNLKMGISSEFSAIEDCRSYYKQAIRTLEIGNILQFDNCIYQYEDFQPYNFIYRAKEEILKEDFYNRSFYILKNYDDENDAELNKTLYVYLKNNHNMTKASADMFIHRNTLRYRLEKITELLGIDLDEGDNSFKLYYAYKAIKFYEKLINT